MQATREKILVVDDEPINIEILQEILRPDYTCIACLSGEDALRLANSHMPPPDLILLDISMQDMDGYEVCRLLKAKEQTREIPIIFVTSLDEAREVARGFEVGAVDYIVKPVSPAVVRARVRTHLKLREALLISEERRRFTQRAVGAYTFEWDIGDQRTYWSEELYQLFGLEPHRHHPSMAAWLASVHDEDRQRCATAVRRAIADNRELEIEWRVAGEHDPERWLMARGKPLRDDHGRLEGYAGVVMEISERKRVEAALRQMAHAFEFGAHGMAIGLAEQGTILVCNPAYAAMLGLSPDQVAGKAVLSFYDPAQREYVAASIAECDLKGKLCYETSMLRADGITFPVQMDLVSVKDDNGKVIYRVGTVQDITERKAAQEALAWEASVREATTELARAIIAAENLEQVSSLVLGEALRLTGSAHGYVSYVQEESGTMMVPCWSDGVVLACPAPTAILAYQSFMGFTGMVLNQRQTIVCNDLGTDTRAKGMPDWHIPIKRLVAVPALMGDALVGHISVANAAADYGEKDLSILERLAGIYALAISRIRVDEQLHNEEVARRAAEEANRAKSEFLATVSHEVRTPLHNILGTTQTLRRLVARRLLTDQQRDEALDDIEKSSRHLAGVIDDILEVSRIESGRLGVNLAAVDLAEVGDAVRSNLSGAAQAKGLALRVASMADLPLVRADPKRLTQVLINVAGNAIKFTQSGWVRLGAHPEPGQPGMLHIEVEDTGPGIPPEHHELIFERFERLDATGAIPGAGLGLAISRKLMGLMGGRIWLESHPGKGAIFHLTVPVWEG